MEQMLAFGVAIRFKRGRPEVSMAARKPKQRRGPPPPGAPRDARPGPPGASGGSWAPLRDAIRRDVEQALAALAFASTVHERLESQRRLFADFPRVIEQIRSGPLERVASSLARLYEGKEQFDLSRFLRDLPLALAQLAATEAKRSAPPPPAEKGSESAPQPPPGESAPPPAGGNGAGVATAGEAGQPPEGEAASEPPAQLGASPAEPASTESVAATPPAPAPEPPAAGPPSHRVELRTRMLAAVPQLSKAVLTYRRTVATVRRAAAPRRSPGPWRSDREVLEEAQRAIEFAQQMFDAYAEAWADQPVQPGIAESMSAEADRFLAWTQLTRYVELAGRGAPQGSPGAGAQQGEGGGPTRSIVAPRNPEPSKPPEPPNPTESAKPAEPAPAEPSAPESGATQGSPGAGGAPATEGNP
ncbi:MAG: hypothetical protein ACJ783_12735 [Myxococcales bacterium]